MKQVNIVGIGMGSVNGITLQGLDIIKKSNFAIGAKRMIESFHNIIGVERENKEEPIKTDFKIVSTDIFNAILSAREHDKIVVLMSGDTGFFSGTKKLAEKLQAEGIETSIVPGISSPSYFSAKIGKSWEEWKIVSLHGRNNNPINYIMNNKETFFLLDKILNPKTVCRMLDDAGLGEVRVYVGENLSYADEKITQGKAKEFIDKTFNQLSVMLVENHLVKEDEIVIHGISDEKFIRGSVPMTKEEIRTISISKLCLKQDDIVYDVGSGTGSVAVEIARQVKFGKVYAIEVNKEGIELTKANKEKFGTYNLDIIEGMAPQALQELPSPDKAFIGGSKGNMKEIVELILSKNPKVRIVANAIALESLGEILKVYKECGLNNTDVVQLYSARTKKVGQYNMLMGMNPIFVITGCKEEEVL